MTTLTLPWPPKELSPNHIAHWAKKAPIKKKYRETCGWLAKTLNIAIPEGPIEFTIIFHPPDKRNRDDDNIISSFKSGRDGLADGWGVNDRRFKPTYTFGEPVKNGAVIIIFK